MRLPERRSLSARSAYCTVLGLRVGHLVYASGNEKPARYVIRQAGTEIICHALNLSEPPDALLMRVSHLASAIAEASDPQLLTSSQMPRVPSNSPG